MHKETKFFEGIQIQYYGNQKRYVNDHMVGLILGCRHHDDCLSVFPSETGLLDSLPRDRRHEVSTSGRCLSNYKIFV